MAAQNNDSVPTFTLKVGLEKGKAKVDESSTRRTQREKELHSKLWLACAGPLINVPRAGDKVFYFLQGHIEQVKAYVKEDFEEDVPSYWLPSKILCTVFSIDLKAEIYNDEVFAQVTLVPGIEAQGSSSSVDGTSQPVVPTMNAYRFAKRLTPSDTSLHGGLSVPRKCADVCFPALDMSKSPPMQDLVAKDLNGKEWLFRHVYRGEPKRHLLTSGWSTFVSQKKLVAGDTCIFIRGENGDLYVGIRRATKLYIDFAASILSGPSMEHGILAGASYAVRARSMFTVYYRPWNCPAEFLIPFDKYVMSTEYDYSIGTRFQMKFDGDECNQQQNCDIFAGTIVGAGDFDPIKWPGSDWRSLKVQWDAPPETKLLPERVSPWQIDTIGKKKKTNPPFISIPKRARPSEPSSSWSLSFFMDDQQPFELGVNGQPKAPLFYPYLNPNWPGQLQIGVGNNHPSPLIMHPLNRSAGYLNSIPNENPPGGRANNWRPSPPLTDLVTSDNGLSLSKGKSPVSVSQAQEAPEDVRAPWTLWENKEKYTPFRANLNSPMQAESYLKKLLSSAKLLPAQPRSNATEITRVSELWKNCGYTKVTLHGTALQGTVQLARFKGYHELVRELDMMFDFNWKLMDGSSGFLIAFTDKENDLMLVGDAPWQEFLEMVETLHVCPDEMVDELVPISVKLPP